MGPVRATAVEKLFPPGAVVYEFTGGASPDELFSSERECVVRAVGRRVREFAAGRLCARAALSELGFKPTPLLSGHDRAPIWPAGAVGSITHTDRYCVAVVGLQTQFAAIGVDAECTEEVSPSLWPFTMRAEELERLHSLEEAECGQMAAAIFSAKEAFYKCQYALTRTWLGFEHVSVDIVGNVFEASVVEPVHPIHRALNPWMGRLKFHQGLVMTGIAVASARASMHSRPLSRQRQARQIKMLD